MPKFATVEKPIEWFTANPENYRVHTPEQVEVLKASIETFGAYKNVVATPDGMLLAGHGVITGAIAAGKKSWPVYIFDGTEEQARALLVADNEIGRKGLVEDDADQLSQLLESLRDDGLMGLTGHDDASLAALLETVAAQAAPTGVPPGGANKPMVTCPDCGSEFPKP